MVEWILVPENNEYFQNKRWYSERNMKCHVELVHVVLSPQLFSQGPAAFCPDSDETFRWELSAL